MISAEPIARTGESAELPQRKMAFSRSGAKAQGTKWKNLLCLPAGQRENNPKAFSIAICASDFPFSPQIA
jgi:hypothetical protein